MLDLEKLAWSRQAAPARAAPLPRSGQAVVPPSFVLGHAFLSEETFELSAERLCRVTRPLGSDAFELEDQVARGAVPVARVGHSAAAVLPPFKV